MWHCVARAAPSDRLLSDAEWAQVAAGIMDRTGLAPRGDEDDAVRWVAVRHGPDHIHIVATLARQDGGRARWSNDYYRVREACRAAEEQFGLRRTAPGDRTAAARPTRAEGEKARRRGWAEPPRVTLKRLVSTAAAGAGSEQEFFARLASDRVQVRLRYSTVDPGQVTGYAVALAGDMSRAGGPVWFGGGKLAADLTLPKLRHRWTAAAGSANGAAGGLTAGERSAIWDHAARTCADAADRIRRLTESGDRAGAADAAWAAADTLHAAAAATGHPAIWRAASTYDRAARHPYGRIPRPSRAGCELRRAARQLSAAAFVTHDRQLASTALIVRLAALAEAVADYRHAQHHAAQAAAARHAAEQLRAAMTGAASSPVPSATRARPATAVNREAFPDRSRPATRPVAAARRPGTVPGRPAQRRWGRPP